jgi:hypothetical protein
MTTHWISRPARMLAALFSWRAPGGYSDYADRDAERVRRELELIRIRFPHHS